MVFLRVAEDGGPQKAVERNLCGAADDFLLHFFGECTFRTSTVTA